MKKNLLMVFLVSWFGITLVSANDGFKLTATVRDFIGISEDPDQGHVDFINYDLEQNYTAVDVFDDFLSPDGKPRYAGTEDGSPGEIHSSDSFDQWYRDVPGVNLAIPHELNFYEEAGGYYFAGYSFFPIDDQGFGNSPGRSHNYAFTLELRAKFRHTPEQKLRITSQDDSLVYLDGMLVIEASGIHEPYGGEIELDRYGLVPGKEYEIAIFFADRMYSGSSLEIATTMPLYQD